MQEEHLALVDSAFAPVPVLRAPFFEQEVVGPGMLNRLGSVQDGTTSSDTEPDEQARQMSISLTLSSF